MANDNHDSHAAPTGLPTGWVWTTIGDVVLRMSNGTTANQSKEKEGIPVTRIETIATGVIDLERVGYTDLPNEAREKYRLLRGDILFSHINSDSHLGKTALFKLDNLLLLHGMNLLLLRPNTAVVAPEYLHYLCNHYRSSGRFAAVAQHAVNQSSINQAKLKQIPFPLAPLPEQLRIVAKIEEQFTRLDAGVAALKRAQANLKRYKAAVLKAACEGKLVAQDASDEPASELLKRILAERPTTKARGRGDSRIAPTDDLPELPSGWSSVHLELVADIVDPQPSHRTPPVVTDGIPYIGMGDIDKDGRINLEEARKVANEVLEEHRIRYQLKEGDFIFGKIGTIGQPVKLIPPFEYALSANVILVQPSPQYVDPAYLFVYMASPFVEKLLIQKSVATSQAAFGILKARLLPTSLPPLAEQRRIVAEVERRLSVVQELEGTLAVNLARAERLRQSILKRAFEGKLV